MAHLHIELWPTATVVVAAAVAIVAMRALERRAERLAIERTRRALERAVADPTEE